MKGTWRAFPLRPEIPEAGIALETLFAGRLLNVDELREKHRKTAVDLGLPLGPLRAMYNSRRAQELRHLAQRNGITSAYDLAVYTAFFVEDRNISRVDVLCDIAESLGLSADEARNVLENGDFRQAVDKDWALSEKKEIVAAPTLLLGERRLVGAQPYEKLSAFLKDAGALDE